MAEYKYLNKINSPADLKLMQEDEIAPLAQEIREFLVDKVSQNGGHLASNLGVVELTLAIHRVFNVPKDHLIFDVGHQSYVHKILTGRAKDFKTLRQFNGLSGYIKKEESKYDSWESGHSSTTISAMSGMIVADEDDSKRVISLIGDAAITNGVALEGLNFLGQMKHKNPIIILNDNKMGISRSVGALSKAFAKLRGKNNRKVRNKNNMTPNFINTFTHKLKRGIKGFIQQDNIFEDLGFDLNELDMSTMPTEDSEFDSTMDDIENVLYKFCAIMFETKAGIYGKISLTGYRIHLSGADEEKETQRRAIIDKYLPETFDYVFSSVSSWIVEGEWDEDGFIQEIKRRYVKEAISHEQKFLNYHFWDLQQEDIDEGMPAVVQKANDGNPSKIIKPMIHNLYYRKLML